ncbi:hypothetical protein SCHPADRAFT_311724 [Schizopora paradoxa]|uniref:TECPR1-like DysF domain-containing protein n=1 Tax=Schizopora paradoxa TaxID=27342 RepID=A0A0H2RR74_9AGAM|nr:hypothetical protein SCHPADRAFT_311724 [Schizopora paradoxa]
MASPSFESSSNLRIDPPTRLIPGSADDSVEARQNFIDRERAARDLFSFLPFRKKKVTPLTRRHSPSRSSTPENITPHSPQDVEPSSTAPGALPGDQGSEVQLDDKYTDKNSTSTLYRWAYVYENQRGTTLFRRFRFSSNALFSFDPPPFSMVQPFASNGRQRQPLFTLSEYPLPDGSWSWLSAEWMIDMRDGNVQHDGYEYNWSFGGKKWRSKAGRFNTGALVRRRRWARLMVRPIVTVEGPEDEKHEGSSNESSVAWDSIWKGDDGDWKRCHAAIRSQDGDGRKLELWEDWIDHRPTGRTNAQRKQWTEDSDYLPSEHARDAVLQSRGGQMNTGPRSDAISGVLQRHGIEILYSFIYPSSRTRFLQILAIAGLIPELPSDEVANSLQFWDRIQEFSRRTEA